MSDPDDFFDDPAMVFGMVLDADRGSLPYSLVHGEALVAAAAWGLGEAGVTLVDATVPWAQLVEAGEAVVLHDALCPLTPADFIADCVARAVQAGVVVVGVRAVTDTVKELRDEDPATLGATVDRDELVTVCSPLVLPGVVVADRLGGLLDASGQLSTTDLPALVAQLAQTVGVERVAAPPQARRVADAADVALLEALTLPHR